MISVEVNFLCDGIEGGGCPEDNCYTTEPGENNLEDHIKEAVMQGGWEFAVSSLGKLQCLCPGCYEEIQAMDYADPKSPFKKKK